MFIKWREENRPLTKEQEAKIAPLRPAWAKKRNPASHRLYAYLAKSIRIEGKPRQKVIYLASIPTCYAQDSSGKEWRAFWFKVYDTLALKRARWETYRDALHEIGQRVNRPMREELHQVICEELGDYPQWKKDYAAILSACEWANTAWAEG